MIGSLGLPEVLFILVLALLIFGPRKLPEIGRTLGRAMGEFRRSANELKRSFDTEMTLEERRQAGDEAERKAARQREESAARGTVSLGEERRAGEGGEEPGGGEEERSGGEEESGDAEGSPAVDEGDADPAERTASGTDRSRGAR